MASSANRITETKRKTHPVMMNRNYIILKWTAAYPLNMIMKIIAIAQHKKLNNASIISAHLAGLLPCDVVREMTYFPH